MRSGLERARSIAVTVVAFVLGTSTVIASPALSRSARTTAGHWEALLPPAGSGFTVAAVHALVLGPDDAIHAAGDFSSLGTPSTPHLVRVRPGDWSVPYSPLVGFNNFTSIVAQPSGGLALGVRTGVFPGVVTWDGDSAWIHPGGSTNGAVYCVATTPSGHVIGGGAFTQVGTLVTNRIAEWTGSQWKPLGLGLAAAPRAMVHADGRLYVGGDFTTAGLEAAQHVAIWSEGAWSALGQGVGGPVYALAVTPTGHVFAGGDFHSADGGVAHNVAEWDGAEWHALGSGTNGVVRALRYDEGVGLYVGGDFDSAGAAPASRIAHWNGTTWSALGSGADGSVLALARDAGGALVVGGTFGAAGGLSSPALARWIDPAALDVDPGPRPARAARLSASPNPFRLTTRVHFELASAAPVTLELFDVSGRLLQRTLDTKEFEAGAHEVTINGLPHGSGLVFMRLRAGSYEASGRFVQLD